METTEHADSFSNPDKTTLRNLVDHLIKTLLPAAAHNNSSIVNNVPPKLSIGGDENMVVSMINGLLRSVINNAWKSCIRISAKMMYGKLVVVSVKDSNSYNTYAVACSLQDVIPLAQKMGGNPDIINQRQNITTIAFRFPIDQQEQSHSQSFE